MRHVDPKNAVPILMRGLDDENSHVRLAAVDSLRLHGPAARDAVKLLERRFLDDSMQDAVWHALHAIDRARYPAKDDAK
jgi:HEAT repeat protein